MNQLRTITNRVKNVRKYDDKSDRATTNLVLDDRVRKLIFKLIEKGVLLSVDSVINTGKEANVFLCDSKVGSVALKIYSTSILSFRNRIEYVEGEHRFETVSRSQKSNSRRMVKLWAEKEFRNLIRTQQLCSICIPKPLFISNTMIGLEFIGYNYAPAPRLKDVVSDLSQTRIVKLYWSIMRAIRTLYIGAGLIHGDLSEYNLLYLNKKLYLIDMGQSIHVTHPNALQFLQIDIININFFFARQGIPVLSVREVLAFVCSPSVPKVNDIYYRSPGTIEYDSMSPRGAPSLDPKLTAYIRYLRAECATTYAPEDINAERSIVNYPVFESLSAITAADYLDNNYADYSQLQSLNIELYESDDSTSNQSMSASMSAPELSEPGEEVEEQERNLKMLDRSKYSKEEWREIQKEVKKDAQERRTKKIPKSVKKRAELLARRRRA